MTHKRTETIRSMIFQLELRNGPLYLHPAPEDVAYDEDHWGSDLIDDLISLKRQLDMTVNLVYLAVAIIGLVMIAKLDGALLYGSLFALTAVSFIPIFLSSNLFWWTKSAQRLTPYLEHIENIVKSLCLYSVRENLWTPRKGQSLEDIQGLLNDRIAELEKVLPINPKGFEKIEFWLVSRERSQMIAARDYFFPKLPARTTTRQQ